MQRKAVGLFKVCVTFLLPPGMKGLNIVKSIDFAIECSAMTHLNQKVVAKM